MLNILAKTMFVVCFGASLIGCAANGAPNVAAPTGLQSALAIGCPIVSAIQQSKTSLNNIQTSALSVLALICPPYAPPTATTVAISDVINAYGILRPLIK